MECSLTVGILAERGWRWMAREWHAAGMPRRPASPATIVVLAAVGALLAGAAGTGAYLGVSNYLQNRATTTGQPGNAGGPTSPEPSATAAPCPTHTIEAVKALGRPGELTIALYVRGTRQNAPGQGLPGEAWICRDSDGEFYYQGHDIDGRRPAVNQNILFLGGEAATVQQQGSAYVVTSRGGGERRVSCDPPEFRSVGGTTWSVDECRDDGTGPSEFAEDAPN